MGMMTLTTEILEQLDIKVGRIVGLVKDSKYEALVEEYELDMTQCELWQDITQVLAYILDAYEYEDLELGFLELGLEAKQVLAQHDDKFLYSKRLLAQYQLLSDNTAIGKILAETVEDIHIIYTSIEKELASIFAANQNEIRRMIEE